MTAAAAAELFVLSAGAAQGLVVALAPRFLAEIGVTLRTTFGAVGAIREKLLAGDRCDVLILTEAMIDQLETERTRRGEYGRRTGSSCAPASGFGPAMHCPTSRIELRSKQKSASSLPTFSCPIRGARRREFTSRRCCSSWASMSSVGTVTPVSERGGRDGCHGAEHCVRYRSVARR